MKEFLFVFLGGGLGSVARFGLGRLINTLVITSFPVATLTVNVAASFVLGFLLAYLDLKNLTANPYNFLLVVGFCGGFSTFSTFSHETFQLMRTGATLLAAGNIILSVSLCLGAIGVGMWLARYWL